MKAAGAEIVDGITIERVQRQQGAGTCRGFKYDINDYLATRGQKAPVHSLDEIVASGKFDPSVARRLKGAAERRRWRRARTATRAKPTRPTAKRSARRSRR